MLKGTLLVLFFTALQLFLPGFICWNVNRLRSCYAVTLKEKATQKISTSQSGLLIGLQVELVDFVSLVGWFCCCLGVFGCLLFGGGVFSNQWQIPSKCLLVLQFKNAAQKWRFLCYGIKLASGTMLASRLQSFQCLGMAVTEYFLCFH